MMPMLPGTPRSTVDPSLRRSLRHTYLLGSPRYIRWLAITDAALLGRSIFEGEFGVARFVGFDDEHDDSF